MRKRKLLLFLFSAAMVLAGWGTSGWSDLLINGAGATFPYPIYSKWFDVYSKQHPGIHFNYQSIGSGGGIRMVTQKTVDFGASDAPMNDEQLKAAPGLLHFPTVMGAVVIAYNVPEVSAALKLTGPVVADIFMAKITKWNDPAIAKLNPGVNLPDSDITPCHRSDGSGTTYIFADYLSKVSPDWSKGMGKATSLKWSGGLGGKGNEGVTALVQQTPGAIGYIELVYALNNHITFAELQNHDGKFVTASLAGVTAAGDAAARLSNRLRVDVNMPAEFRVSITDSPGADSYPISSFTYLLVYRQQTDKAKGQQIIDFLKWAVHDGQQYGPSMQYAPLPDPVVALEDKQIKEIRLPK
jgi:phosphate transport system substrate-binding protein